MAKREDAATACFIVNVVIEVKKMRVVGNIKETQAIDVLPG